jgi:hypothetical protein
MLIFKHKYSIVLLFSAFETVKQFFLSDSFISDLLIRSPFSVNHYYNCSYISQPQYFRTQNIRNERPEPESDHLPTSFAREYGSANLQLFRHSACSLVCKLKCIYYFICLTELKQIYLL